MVTGVGCQVKQFFKSKNKGKIKVKIIWSHTNRECANEDMVY